MHADAQTLRKILELERSRGYGDSAVIGGLDRYLERWVGTAPPPSGDAPPAPTSYSALDAGQRQEWVQRMLHWLDDEDQEGPVAAATATAVDDPLGLSITAIKGMGPRMVPRFRRLGVEQVRDMLYLFPRRHIDYTSRKAIAQLEVGAEQTAVVTVWEMQETTLGGRPSTGAVVGDETGTMRVVWFNQPYLARQIDTNAQVVLSGRVSTYKGVKVFLSPEYEPLTAELVHTGRLIPVYPLTQGLSQRVVRRLVKEAVDRWGRRVPDFLPAEVLQRAHLPRLDVAIREAHYPRDEQAKDEARRRLAFDELFILQLGVLSRRRDFREGAQAHPIPPATETLDAFIGALPFTITGAQRRSLDDIVADLGRDRPMSRLLQGEVGSGKTVVATAALLATAAAGLQGAFMAPTELLAEQHFSTIADIMARAGHSGERGEGMATVCGLLPRPLGIALLHGGMRGSDKERVQHAIAAGEADIVVGTHALIQEQVDFERLGLVVVDEQHRFGVMQRQALRQKGHNPHLLVMTATPIPRSLALTLYGDLDLSVLDELPAGRRAIKTTWREAGERARAYRFVRQQVEEGRQAFIICPLIEESPSIEARAATREYERLSTEVFPQLRLGLLHGRMRPADKEATMRRFRSADIDILVSTPVVEVGIDVPNATVMLIEGADRFGLAQLHQFRGRVGRGQHQSYCILIADDPSPEGRERLDLIERIEDGFALAEEDLRLRGPGEFFGTRQSGLPDLKMARLSDVALLELARSEAIHLFQRDPTLERPEHRPLAAELARSWCDQGAGGEA